MRLADVIMPEEHYNMPLGWERYEHSQAHEKEARKLALTLARKVFPELRKYQGETLPDLWISGLLEEETHAKKTVKIN